MKYAIIENGIVTNIATSDAALAENWVEAGTAQIGDLWDGKSFSSPAVVVTSDMVNPERDRRLTLDFEFNGKMYQRDTKSLQRITGAGTLAGLFIGAGGSPTSLKWHATSEVPNPDDFAWIASDDSLTPMDAATVFAFSREAATVETRLIFAAKALRSMDPIPDDFTDDKWWP